MINYCYIKIFLFILVHRSYQRCILVLRGMRTVSLINSSTQILSCGHFIYRVEFLAKGRVVNNNFQLFFYTEINTIICFQILHFVLRIFSLFEMFKKHLIDILKTDHGTDFSAKIQLKMMGHNPTFTFEQI